MITDKENKKLDKLPAWVEDQISNWRTSVEMYRLRNSGTSIREIAKMYDVSTQNIYERINVVKRRLKD